MTATATPTTTPSPPAPPASAGNQPAEAGPAASPEAPAGDQGGGTGEGTEGTPVEEASSESTDLGTESKGGTDQPDGESDRHEFRRAAQHLFGGDQVGRDKFVFYLSSGERGRPAERLSRSLDGLARHAFVPPAGWDACRIGFSDRHTVLLRGTPGHGRATMAIRLLQTVEAREIFELSPRIDITRMAEQLTGRLLEPGTAFLLHQPQDIARLDAFTLHSIEDVLAEAGARLVITIGDGVPLQDEGLLRYQLDLPSAPPRRMILEQHLYHLAGEERGEQILGQPAVVDLIAQQLDGDRVTCERASSLASHLSCALDPIDAERISSLMQRSITNEFANWFESLDTVRVRCFAVSLAVLGGLSCEEVADAARRLHDRLSNGGKVVLGENNVLRVAGGDPFQPDQDRLLTLLQARVEQTTVRTPYGHAPATTIAYRDPDYPKQVIERAWQSYQFKDKLLAWLDELVTARSSQVRIHACMALGLVATLAFEYVRSRVLTQWAYDQSLWKNEAAADALRVVATVPELQPGATWLVDCWYRSGNPDAQCTAALAHGTQLGQPDPVRSIQALERLTMVGDPSVRVGIARGFASLLADDPALAVQIYQVVERCTADPDRAFTGQYVFLFLAADVHIDVPGSDGVVARWPVLLYLAREQEELRGPLFECWARVLTEGAALTMAQQVLRAWAGRAEGDAGVRESFARMVRAVARRDPRAGAVLARCARQWNSDEELQPMPAVALAISNVVPGLRSKGPR